MTIYYKIKLNIKTSWEIIIIVCCTTIFVELEVNN